MTVRTTDFCDSVDTVDEEILADVFFRREIREVRRVIDADDELTLLPPVGGG